MKNSFYAYAHAYAKQVYVLVSLKGKKARYSSNVYNDFK